MERLKNASQAYLETAEGSTAERLRFLQGLWSVQSTAVVGGEPYGPAEKPAAAESLVSGQQLFLLNPPSIDLAAYAATVKEISAYVSDSAVLPSEQNEALSQADFAPAIEKNFESASSRPAEFIELATRQMTEESEGLTGPTVAFILQSALLPFLKDASKAAIEALGDFDWHTWDSGDCPVCGTPATMGKMGESTKHQGAERTLWCSVCDAEWGYDRLRCVRCGSRRSEDFRYIHLKEDPAHRAHVCDKCKGYIKVTFIDDLDKPFAFPVEDAVSANMDAAARAEGYSQEPSGPQPSSEES